MLTAKKRGAWKPARPPRASKVQCRFHQKLLTTATDERRRGGHEVVGAEALDAEREHGAG